MEPWSTTRPLHAASDLVAATVEDDTSTVSATELPANLATPSSPEAASAQMPRAPGPHTDAASASLPSTLPGLQDLQPQPATPGEQQSVTAASPGSGMPDPHAPAMPVPDELHNHPGHVTSRFLSGLFPLSWSTSAPRETEPCIQFPVPPKPDSRQDSLAAAPPETPPQAGQQPKRPSSLSRKAVHRFAHLAYLTQTCIDEGAPSVRAIFFAAQVTTGIHRVYIAFGLAVSLSIYMVIGSSAPLVCDLICSVIPACSSMRTIEYSTKEQDAKWMTYWVLFACFSITDHFSGKILSYFPFYWLLKVAFLVYCFFPVRRNGSWFIYYRIIRRYILRYGESADRTSQSPTEMPGTLSADKMPEPMEGSCQQPREDL